MVSVDQCLLRLVEPLSIAIGRVKIACLLKQIMICEIMMPELFVSNVIT